MKKEIEQMLKDFLIGSDGYYEDSEISILAEKIIKTENVIKKRRNIMKSIKEELNIVIEKAIEKSDLENRQRAMIMARFEFIIDKLQEISDKVEMLDKVVNGRLP